VVGFAGAAVLGVDVDVCGERLGGGEGPRVYGFEG
jgi:hypothetical protein